MKWVLIIALSIVFVMVVAALLYIIESFVAVAACLHIIKSFDKEENIK